VTVEDTSAPTFTDCPANITIEATAGCKALVNWTAPIASDNCNITTTSNSHSPGDEFGIGTTLITYSATDDSGNEGTCTFEVTVEDTSAPAFTDCPANITIQAATNCKAVVDWIPPVATDNCGIASTNFSHTPGSEFDIGTTIVTYDATDVNGNTLTCQFNVEVTYTQAPEILNCPANIQATADETEQAVVTWSEPEFDLLCGTLSIQKTHEPGSRFNVGTTQVEYTASDGLGNNSVCSFTINVELTKIEIEISKIITPNGDGFNDFWEITNLENYPDNSVTIVDRWGGVLFQSSGYDNQSGAWSGLNKNGTLVPTGTYFYLLEIRYGSQNLKWDGFIELVQ
jgi:gliding motility-associated-like protein